MYLMYLRRIIVHGLSDLMTKSYAGLFCNMLGAMELVNHGPACVKMVTRRKKFLLKRDENLCGCGTRGLRLSP